VRKNAYKKLEYNFVDCFAKMSAVEKSSFFEEKLVEISFNVKTPGEASATIVRDSLSTSFITLDIINRFFYSWVLPFAGAFRESKNFARLLLLLGPFSTVAVRHSSTRLNLL
jgi:hypothetical protein